MFKGKTRMVLHTKYVTTHNKSLKSLKLTSNDLLIQIEQMYVY
jgi:hypothetical protein